MEWIVAAAFLVAGASLCAGAVAGWNRQSVPGARLFAAAAAVAGLAALTVGTSVATGAPEPAVLVPVVVAGLSVPVPWLLFALAYTGHDRLVAVRFGAVVAAVPAAGLLATALIVGSPLVPGVELPPPGTGGLAATAVALLGLLQWFALLYAGGLVAAGSGLLLWTFHRYDHLDSTSGTLLCVFGTVPWVGMLFGLRVADVDPLALPATAAAGLLAGGLAVGSGLARRRLFQDVPAAGAVGRSRLVEGLVDAVVVLDDDGTVVDLNPAAEAALSTSTTEAVGAGLEAVAGVSLSTLRREDAVDLDPGSHRRLFEPAVSELTDRRGHPLGHAVVLRDVTARITRQQRLSVFNRVLRHNVRNRATVIVGHGEYVEAAAEDPEVAESAAEAVAAARDLSRLSDEARAIEEVMDASDESLDDVRLVSLVEDVVATVGADDVADCEVPADLVVPEADDLLELALANLVEAAVEHAEEVSVEVRADLDRDRERPLRVRVEGGGPGVPAAELEAVEGGVETDLDHASDLGLWAARWSVTRLGGTLSFDRPDRGTAVTVWLPRARRVAGDDAG